MQIEWELTADNIRDLWQQHADFYGWLKVIDAEYDDLADAVVFTLEIDEEDLDQLDGSAYIIGNLLN